MATRPAVSIGRRPWLRLSMDPLTGGALVSHILLLTPWPPATRSLRGPRRVRREEDMGEKGLGWEVG